jgi:hypothetical protein
VQDPKVLISVLNWNAAANTIDAIRSVLNSNYNNYTIFIEDNNSIDNSVQEIKEAFPSIRIKSLSKNMGYAGGHKIAAGIAKKEKYDLLWILNNDVKVFSDSLTELVNAYTRNKKSIFGSVTLGEDGQTIQFSGGAEMIDESTYDESVKYNQFEGRKLTDTIMLERRVSDLAGASILIPVSLIDKYGFIDTKYFLYGEETDYCYRLRRKYGIQSIIVPKSIIIHTGSASFDISKKLEFIKAYYRSRNIYYIYKKHFKDYVFTDVLGLPHLIKFFIKHHLFNIPVERDKEYWLKYYKNLGHFHAKINLMGKYLEPNDFIKGNVGIKE